MNSSSRFPNGKDFVLTRVALLLVASTMVASCVSPKPPNSKDFALKENAPLKENSANTPCAKPIINPGKKPRRTKDAPAWEPCVNYLPGLVQSDPLKQGKSEDVLIIAAISGGGKRSASFAYGVFQALNQFMIDLPKERVSDKAAEYTPRSLLEEVDLISAVSGGAMTASYYALHHNNTFLPKQNASCGFESFLYEDTGAKIWGLYLFPWKWGWIMDSSYGSNDVMAKFFSERLFGMPAEQQYQPKKKKELLTAEQEGIDLSSYCAKPTDDRPNGAIYADLYDQGPPYLLLSSTDVTRGLTFPYSQDGFDLVCSDVSEFPLAWALAGTNAFPVVLSTINLRNKHADTEVDSPCKPKRNAKLAKVFDDSIDCVPLESVLDESTEGAIPQDNKFFRSKTILETATTCYARPGNWAYVHLADGGMTDNFGLKGITDWFFTHKETPSFWNLVLTTKRAQLLIIDGQRDVDSKIAREPQGPDVLDAVGSMISNSVDQSNISALAEARDLFEVLSSYLAIRDLVIMDEWQKETYGEKQYDANSFQQFSDFLDCVENPSATTAICKSIDEGFEQRFNSYVAGVRKLKLAAEFKAKFAPILSASTTIWNAEYYGATGARVNWNSDAVKVILGNNLHGLGKGKKNPASADDLMKANTLLRGKIERIKTFHARKVQDERDGKPTVVRVPNYWVDITKISAVDDCFSNRRRLVMSSDTGMGLKHEEIAAAIEAGIDVANRHANSILTFLKTGERSPLPSCQTWLGGQTATEGAKSLDPEAAERKY